MTDQPTTPATSDDDKAPGSAPDEDASLAPPPDELNPALIDARQTFIITCIGIALFAGAVFVFIL
jgi:hypothetical protein